MRCFVRRQSVAPGNQLCCHKLIDRIHANRYGGTCIDLVETQTSKAIKEIAVIIDDPVRLVLVGINCGGDYVITPVSCCVAVSNCHCLVKLASRSRDHHCPSDLEGLAFGLCQELNERHTSDGGRSCDVGALSEI